VLLFPERGFLPPPDPHALQTAMAASRTQRASQAAAARTMMAATASAAALPAASLPMPVHQAAALAAEMRAARRYAWPLRTRRW
jgi:hypothetical protein